MAARGGTAGCGIEKVVLSAMWTELANTNQPSIRPAARIEVRRMANSLAVTALLIVGGSDREGDYAKVG